MSIAARSTSSVLVDGTPDDGEYVDVFYVETIEEVEALADKIGEACNGIFAMCPNFIEDIDDETGDFLETGQFELELYISNPKHKFKDQEEFDVFKRFIYSNLGQYSIKYEVSDDFEVVVSKGVIPDFKPKGKVEK